MYNLVRKCKRGWGRYFWKSYVNFVKINKNDKKCTYSIYYILYKYISIAYFIFEEINEE